MTNPSEQVEKGYFNALTSSNFKTAQDGRKLFFPWGVMSTGYVIPTQQQYEQLRRQIKTYVIVSMVLIIATGITLPFYVSLGAAVLAAIFYAAWTPSLVRGLPLSAERMSIRENIATQARTHNAGTLWLLEIASLIFVAVGIVMIIMEPREWPLALLSIVFFGFCAAMFARMLIVRRRETSERS